MRLRECIVTGFLMIRPSRTSLRIVWPSVSVSGTVPIASRGRRHTRVGVTDLIHFVRVQPDLAFAAVHNGRCETLLSAEIDPVENRRAHQSAFVRLFPLSPKVK